MLRHPKYANDPNLQHVRGESKHAFSHPVGSTVLHCTCRFNLSELETIPSYCSIQTMQPSFTTPPPKKKKMSESEMKKKNVYKFTPIIIKVHEFCKDKQTNKQIQTKKRRPNKQKLYTETCMKFDPAHPTHFSSGTRRDRSPLHPAAMNATVCSLPLAMQMHARNSREVSRSINVALIMPKTYLSQGRNYHFFLVA